MSLLPNGGLPLTILAGLPNNLALDIKNIMEERFQLPSGQSTRKFLQLVGGENGSNYSDHIVKKTLEVLADTVKSKRKTATKENQYSPSHISLIYLVGDDSPGYQALFSYFFLFCRCVGIPKTEKPWIEYKANELANMYEKTVTEMNIWNNERASAPFYLPMRNFLIEGSTPLKDKYLVWVKQNQNSLLKENIQFKSCRDKSKCLDCKSDKQRIPVDDRGLCFVSGARHGKLHDLLENGHTSTKARQAQFTLEGLYRFGQPIEPGTQTDVQFERGVSLKNTQFECASSGTTVSRDTSYVNIYTNDFVRYPKK